MTSSKKCQQKSRISQMKDATNYIVSVVLLFFRGLLVRIPCPMLQQRP